MWQDEYINDIWRHGSSDRDIFDRVRFLDNEGPNCKNPFKTGDRVMLKTGTTELTVVRTAGPNVRAVYKGGREQRWRPASDYNLVKAHQNKTTIKGDKKMNSVKLYQTKEANPRFGTYLATNSQNKIVLEMKGTGVPELFNVNDIEVVTPYTYNVQFNGTGKAYAYLGQEGEVEVGDLLLKTDGTHGISIAKVVAVNTKSEMADKFFDGVKIATTPLRAG
jgi:hypothetical protein